MRVARAIASVAGAAAIASCGSTTSSSPPVTEDPGVRAAAAQAYTTAAARANELKAALQEGVCRSSDNASLKACSSGLADAEQDFENALVAIHFPLAAQGDATSLIAIDKRVIMEERAFAASPNPDADATDFTAIQSDDKLLAVAVAALRRDLGLAPPPSLTATPSA